MQNRAVCFKKSNVEDLREKLSGLIKDSQRVNQLKQTASSYILKKYNWDEIVEKTLSIYEVHQ